LDNLLRRREKTTQQLAKEVNVTGS
jgi:hypothetical protein